MTPLRFSRRMFDQHPGDAQYACSVTRFKRRMPASEIALYLIAAVAVVVIYLTR